MEAWLDRVMVEHTCPDCNGSRLRATRLKFRIAGRNIDDFGRMNFDELRPFLDSVKPDRAAGRRRPANPHGDRQAH